MGRRMKVNIFDRDFQQLITTKLAVLLAGRREITLACPPHTP